MDDFEITPEIIRTAERLVILMPPNAASAQGLGLRLHESRLETLMTDRTGENDECVEYSNLDWSPVGDNAIIKAVTISILLREIGSVAIILHKMLDEAKRAAFEELGVDLNNTES